MDYDVNSQLTVFACLDCGIDQFGTAGNDDFLVEVGADYELLDGFTVGLQADFSTVNTCSFDFEDAEITFTRYF